MIGLFAVNNGGGWAVYGRAYFGWTGLDYQDLLFSAPTEEEVRSWLVEHGGVET